MGRMIWLEVVLGSALMGGVSGGLVAAWREPPVRVLSKTAGAAPEVQELGDRVASVERALLELRGQRQLAARIRGHSGAGTTAEAGSAAIAADGSRSVDDPVFYTAVRDTLDRMESERAAERRDEVARQAAQGWANQLTRELKLNDEQKGAVAEIGAEFSQKVHELSVAEDGTETLDPQARNAQITALRDQYEERLEGVLDGRQMSSFRNLGRKLQFGFAPE